MPIFLSSNEVTKFFCPVSMALNKSCCYHTQLWWICCAKSFHRSASLLKTFTDKYYMAILASWAIALASSYLAGNEVSHVGLYHLAILASLALALSCISIIIYHTWQWGEPCRACRPWGRWQRWPPPSSGVCLCAWIWDWGGCWMFECELLVGQLISIDENAWGR